MRREAVLRLGMSFLRLAKHAERLRCHRVLDGLCKRRGSSAAARCRWGRRLGWPLGGGKGL